MLRILFNDLTLSNKYPNLSRRNFCSSKLQVYKDNFITRNPQYIKLKNIEVDSSFVTNKKLKKEIEQERLNNIYFQINYIILYQESKIDTNIVKYYVEDTKPDQIESKGEYEEHMKKLLKKKGIIVDDYKIKKLTVFNDFKLSDKIKIGLISCSSLILVFSIGAISGFAYVAAILIDMYTSSR